MAAFWHHFDRYEDIFVVMSRPLVYKALLVALGAACAYYIYLFTTKHEEIFGKKINFQNAIVYMLPELMYLALVPVLREYKVSYAAGVFYHLIFWFFAPMKGLYLSRLAAADQPNSRLRSLLNNNLVRYLAMTVAVTGLFFIFSPVMSKMDWSFLFSDSKLVLNQRRINWLEYVSYFGLLHINLSFLFSNLNPKWILNFVAWSKTTPKDTTTSFVQKSSDFSKNSVTLRDLSEDL